MTDQQALRPETVKVTSPDGKQTIEVSRKAYELSYKQAGYTLASDRKATTSTPIRESRAQAGAAAKAANARGRTSTTRSTTRAAAAPKPAAEGESTIEGKSGPASAEAGKPESSGGDPTGEQPATEPGSEGEGAGEGEGQSEGRQVRL